jgi:hypothetical protein
MNDINPGGIVQLVLMLTFYLVPSIVAYRRGHHYRHVILAVNVIGGTTGIGWAVAMVWAAWPVDKSLADPVLGNVTGKGYRNAGDTLGAVSFGAVAWLPGRASCV